MPVNQRYEAAAVVLHDRQEQSVLWRTEIQRLVLPCLTNAFRLPPAGVLEYFDQQVADRDPVAAALRSIEGNLHDKLPLTDLAKLCHLSVDHFSGVFHQLLGPTRTRNQLRTLPLF